MKNKIRPSLVQRLRSWIGSRSGAWARLSVYIPIVLLATVGLLIETIFTTDYAAFSVQNLEVVKGFRFPKVRGQLTNVGNDTVDFITIEWRGYIGNKDRVLLYGHSDIFSFPEARNTLRPGSSTLFAVPTTGPEPEARGRIPRQVAEFVAPPSDVQKELFINRTAVQVHGSSSAAQGRQTNSILIALALMLATVFVVGLRWEDPPAAFRHWHTHIALVLAVALSAMLIWVEWPYLLSDDLTSVLGGIAGLVVFCLILFGLARLTWAVRQRLTRARQST